MSGINNLDNIFKTGPAANNNVTKKTKSTPGANLESNIFSMDSLEGDLRLIDSLIGIDPKNEKLTNAKKEFELFLVQNKQDNKNSINA